MKCRKRLDDVRTGGWHFLRDQFGGSPEARPNGIRHVGGAKLNQALVRNVRTCPPMQRERSQAAQTARIRVPKRSTGTEQPVVGTKALSWSWTEGAALFSRGHRPTGNGRSPWARQGRWTCVPTAEHREPYESRGSRTVLGARGGEIPPRDSPQCMARPRGARWSVELANVRAASMYQAS